jgi:hypothetical protein
MSGTFAAGAARLAGVTPRLLGWRPDDFWNATPAELATIFAAVLRSLDELGTQDERVSGTPLTRGELTALMEQDRHG